MDILKQIFPIAFKSSEKNEFISSLIIHIIVLIVGGALLALIGALDLPVLGWILGIVGSALDLYCLAGIAISILIYLKIMKA